MLGQYQESLLSPCPRFGPAGAAQRHRAAASRFGGAPSPTAAGDVQASQYDMDDPFMAPGAHLIFQACIRPWRELLTSPLLRRKSPLITPRQRTNCVTES